MRKVSVDTEVLFFIAFHAYLLQQSDFREKFEMLHAEYLKDPLSFRALSKLDVLRLKKMQEAYKTGRINLFEGAEIDIESIPPRSTEKSHSSHIDICMSLFKNRKDLLEPITGPIDSVCSEYPVYGGFIDLLVISGGCAYIIEVKSQPADHDIIGQVMKYYVGLSLQLIRKMFFEVKMLTVCPGYTPDAFRGLKQIGANPLLLNMSTLSVQPCL